MGTRRSVSPLLLCAGLTLASASGIGLDAAAGSAAAGPRALSARRAGRQHGRPLARPQLLAADAQHVFDVTAFGAKGDNSTDDTGAFAKALEAAHAAGGGMVSVPPGLFVLAGKLTIPPGVSLTGSYRVVPSHDIRGHQPITDGTVLIPTGGRGSIGCPPDPESSDPDLDCEDAFITITENGLVQGLVVWYKEQERTATPVPYPWTFYLGDPKKVYSGGASADNAAVMDVEVLGCWNCVAAVQAHRHYIARIQGHPINIGVFVDATCVPSPAPFLRPLSSTAAAPLTSPLCADTTSAASRTSTLIRGTPTAIPSTTGRPPTAALLSSAARTGSTSSTPSPLPTPLATTSSSGRRAR